MTRRLFGATTLTVRIGETQFHVMNGLSRRDPRRLAQQPMHVLGHDDVSVDAHLEAAAHLLQNLEKQIVDRRRIEARPPMVAGEGHENNTRVRIFLRSTVVD